MTMRSSIRPRAGLRGIQPWSAVAVVGVLSGCITRDHSGGDGGWRLVRAYDITALGSLARTDPAFAWRPVAQMQESCGPSRTPVGLGITETEALTHGLMGAVVLELEGPWDSTRSLDRDSLEVWYRVADGAYGEGRQPTISLGDDDREGGWVRLEPAVLPRALRVSVSDSAAVLDETEDGASSPQSVDTSDSAWQVGSVRRTLSLQLCLEHKLGRGWRKFTTEELDEALLLKVSEQPEDPGLAYVGQGARVPLMLGNPDACFEKDARHSSQARGVRATRPAPYLHASDVWNGELRTCGEEEARLGRSMPSGMVPLFLQFGELWTLPRAPTYETLEVQLGDRSEDGLPVVSAVHTRVEALSPRTVEVSLTPPAPEEDQVPFSSKVSEHIAVAPIPTPILSEAPLFGPAESPDQGAVDAERGNALFDILGKVPLRYPTFFRGDLDEYRGENSRVVPLIIPAWQLLPLACSELGEEASQGCDEDTFWDAERQTLREDPVNRLLAHPDRLSVRVRGRTVEGEETWYELNPAWGPHAFARSVRSVATGRRGERQAGYITIGYQQDGVDLSSLTTDPLPGLLVGSSFILLFWLGMGLRRLSDLWITPPEIRVDRWSTRPPKKKSTGAPPKAVTK